MKNYSLKSLLVVIATMAFMFSCTQEEMITSPTAETSDFDVIEGQYIVVLNTQKTGDASSRFPGDYARAREFVKENARNILMENNLPKENIESMEHVYAATINGFNIKLDAQGLERLSNDERVAYIEKDRMIILAPPCGTPNGGPCDEDPGDGGGDTSQSTPYGISRVNGGVTYTGSNVAWIIDTGIDLDHEDLNVDASRGFNAFTSGRDSKSLDDGNGHGSHVAGTVAAIDNSVGVIGVAAGATVIPVKVLDSRGSGSYSGVIAGVDHVGANGSNGDVANMSLGGGASQAVDDAVIAASSNGVKFTLAAGNDGDDANNSSPARANGSNIYTISAMDSGDVFAYFSNWGNPPVDYCTPGVSITSTWKDGGYNTISGTSMAAPHAAGILLLGNPSTDGNVSGDPDGEPDPIMVH